MSRTFLSDFTDANGQVPLFHFAPAGTQEPFETDPTRLGQNPWSQSERKSEGSPKSFFYVDLADKEGFFGGKPLFHTKYDASKIYDATKDADSHAERSHNVTALIDRLKDAGYHGIFYSGVFPTVAMWRRVTMKKIDEPQKLSRFASTPPGYVYADYLAEESKPGAHIARASDDWATYHHGLRTRELEHVAHVVLPDHDLSVWHSSPHDHLDPLAPFYYVAHITDTGPNYHVKLKSVKHLGELLADYPKQTRIDTMRKAHAHGLPLNENVGPQKLARALQHIDSEHNALQRAVYTPDGMVDTAAVGALADHMQENGRVGAHLLRAGIADGSMLPLHQIPYGGWQGKARWLDKHTYVRPEETDHGVSLSVVHAPDDQGIEGFARERLPKHILYHVPVKNREHLRELTADWKPEDRVALFRDLVLASKIEAPTKLARSKGPDREKLRSVGEWLAKNGAMPGYGQIFLKDGHVWYVGGDGDEWEKGIDPRKKFAEIPGVSKVTYEAEAFPPDRDTWEPVKLARMRAPAGGIIVNNQFQRGGQFMMKAFKRIRDVAAKLVKLARPAEQTPTLPGSAFHGSDPVRPLSLDELKQMEDDHGIAEKHKLSRRVKPDGTGGFTANKEHVAAFLDRLSNKRLVGHRLRTALTDPRRTDDQKAAYAALHMAHEAKEFLDATRANGAGEWYGEHVNDLERTIHKVFGEGFEPGSHRHTLFKALVALSSSGTNPKTNALAAYKMMREGQRRRPDHPFLGVPAYNEPALREWMQKAGDGFPFAPGHTEVDEKTPPEAERNWFVKNVLPRLKELHETPKAVGYQGRPAVIVDRLGHPDHGKLVEYTAGGKDYLTPEGGSLYQRHRGKRALRKVILPITDQHGRLKPKGWNAMAAQVESGVERLQKLIRTVGEKRAADFMLTPQKDSTFQRLFGYTPDRAQVGTDENLPGAFMFGPKFGAFLLNLHNNTKPEHARWLTADKWWSRSWNRFMGTLLTGSGRGKHVEAPRGRAERNLMAQAAQEATKAAGLRSVAELQAVLWYYEQSLWRMLGVKAAKSYSFRDGAKAILKADQAHTDKITDFPYGYNVPHRLARPVPKVLADLHAADSPHAVADKLLGSRSHRRLGSNKALVRSGEDIHIVLHQTPVVTLHKDGDFTLRTGGWPTQTTKRTIHAVTGLPMSIRAGVVHVGDKPLEEGRRISEYLFPKSPEQDFRPEHAIPEDYYA